MGKLKGKNYYYYYYYNIKPKGNIKKRICRFLKTWETKESFATKVDFVKQCENHLQR